MTGNAVGDDLGWAVFLVSVLVGGLLAAVLLTRSSEDGPPVCARFRGRRPADWEEMSEDEFRAMIDEQVYLGARDIRLAAVWQDIEPRPGDYEWEALDGRLQIALDAGLTPLLLIHTHPDWVTGFGEIGSGAAEAYGDFAGEVARRYSDRVHAYEIWNEPNLERFWPDPDPEAFAELLAAAGPRIAAADPEAEIVSGGLSPGDEPGEHLGRTGGLPPSALRAGRAGVLHGGRHAPLLLSGTTLGRFGLERLRPDGADDGPHG
ncbi:cellulase family glycosylhydrolase [Corynebacterium suedekumii]|nr:cellulase family glycosylhydrolase [Corynebacterium suedekumii]